MSDESSTIPPGQFVCPGCDLAYEAEAGDVARVEQCPGCGQPILIPAIDGSSELPEETEETAEPTDEDHLNRLHVQQLTRERRSLIRSRSHAIVGVGLCVVGAGELLPLSIRAIYQHQFGIWPATYLVFGLYLPFAAWQLTQLALKLHRQSKVELLDEPSTPPDFSTLQDGSQFVENLKKMREGK